MDKIYFLHDALIISQISVWEMVLFSQLLYLMFCNGPNHFFLFSYLQHCRSKNLLGIWFLFLPISLFGYFCFTHYTENSFFMQETCNHLHELQLKETNQYFIFVSQGNHKKKRSNIFFDIFFTGFWWVYESCFGWCRRSTSQNQEKETSWYGLFF